MAPATNMRYDSEREQNLKQHNLSVKGVNSLPGHNVFSFVSVTPLETRSLILYIVDVFPSDTRIASQKHCRSFRALSLLQSPSIRRIILSGFIAV